MIQRVSLVLEEAQRAIAAVLEEAEREGRPVAVAVVDANGDLISCARMDGAHARVLRFAVRKAYTAAVMGRDTLTFKKELQERGRTLSDYGDPSFTTLQGGLPIISEDKVVGAIGAGGSARERDVEMAQIGVRAIGVSTKRKNR